MAADPRNRRERGGKPRRAPTRGATPRRDLGRRVSMSGSCSRPPIRVKPSLRTATTGRLRQQPPRPDPDARQPPRWCRRVRRCSPERHLPVPDPTPTPLRRRQTDRDRRRDTSMPRLRLQAGRGTRRQPRRRRPVGSTSQDRQRAIGWARRRSESSRSPHGIRAHETR